MRYIKLNRGRATLVDDNDYTYLNQWLWRYSTTGYAVRVVLENGKQKTIWMHRLINDTPLGMVTDHINGDRLDNRRSNLRNATHAENTRNAKVRKDNSTGCKGVCWREKSKDYVVYINVNKKRIHLKTYKLLEDAINARKEAENRYHGQFAYSLGG